MEQAIPSSLSELAHLVGNTPLLAIDLSYRGVPRRIYAKAEHLNFTGSIKDRMALHILRRGYETGALRPGAPIAEATSGNTGISFAALGRALGHPVHIFIPAWMSRERIDLIRSLGAHVRLVGHDEDGFVGAIELAERYAEEHDDAFLPRQFSNEHNTESHYLGTGPELWWQLEFEGLTAHAFVAGVGTGGTVMGVGRYLRERAPGTRIHPLEPANSPTLRTGRQVGTHRIQGISDEFVPELVDLSSLDSIVSVHDGDAILMAQRLAAELGLGVGISSGANLLGALKLAEGIGRDAVVATVFPDDNKKYLSTDLLRAEPVAEDYLTPEVALLGFAALKRTCVTCCEGEACGRRRHLLDTALALGSSPGAPDPPCLRET